MITNRVIVEMEGRECYGKRKFSPSHLQIVKINRKSYRGEEPDVMISIVPFVDHKLELHLLNFEFLEADKEYVIDALERGGSALFTYGEVPKGSPNRPQAVGSKPVKTSGLRVSYFVGGNVVIQPINSRGKLSPVAQLVISPDEAIKLANAIRNI